MASSHQQDLVRSFTVARPGSHHDDADGVPIRIFSIHKCGREDCVCARSPAESALVAFCRPTGEDEWIVAAHSFGVTDDLDGLEEKLREQDAEHWEILARFGALIGEPWSGVLKRRPGRLGGAQATLLLHAERHPVVLQLIRDAELDDLRELRRQRTSGGEQIGGLGVMIIIEEVGGDDDDEAGDE